MNITLFDAYSGFGGATPGSTILLHAAEVQTELARLGITRALVRRVPEDLEGDAASSNERLYASCAGHPEFLPCPVVLPSTGGDVASEEEQVTTHLVRGAGAVWVRPALDYWSLAPWCSDAMFAALAQHRFPMLIVASMVSPEQIAEIASRHTALPILLAGSSYRDQRVLLPLLKAHPNIHVVLGGSYAVHGGIEQLAAEVGATRVLFGTGYPHTEPGAAVTYLMYADMSDKEKQLIGSRNLERLLAEVVP